MASYSTHMLQAKHMISYRYICEHCAQDSQSQIREISAIVEKRTKYKQSLTPDQESQLNQELRTRLIQNVQEEKNLVQAGDYSFFNGRCPHCGKHQSWACGSLENKVKLKARQAMALALLIGFIIFLILSGDYGFWTTALCCAGACVATYPIAYLIFYIKWKSIRREASEALCKNLPNIEWNGM